MISYLPPKNDQKWLYWIAYGFSEPQNVKYCLLKIIIKLSRNCLILSIKARDNSYYYGQYVSKRKRLLMQEILLRAIPEIWWQWHNKCNKVNRILKQKRKGKGRIWRPKSKYIDSIENYLKIQQWKAKAKDKNTRKKIPRRTTKSWGAIDDNDVINLCVTILGSFELYKGKFFGATTRKQRWD